MLRGLFSKKSDNVGELLELPLESVSYDECLDFLRGLEKPDFDKMVKVAGIYRTADEQACKVYGAEPKETAGTPIKVKVVK